MKFVKSSLLVKLVILILVVYATVTLVRLRSQISEKEARGSAGLNKPPVRQANTARKIDPPAEIRSDALDTARRARNEVAPTEPTSDSGTRRRVEDFGSFRK